MESHRELSAIIAGITDPEEMADLLEEILTPKELKDLTLRWELLKSLHSGQTQRAIAAEYKISLCKITRGSKILKKQESIINKILRKHYPGGEKRDDETNDI